MDLTPPETRARFDLPKGRWPLSARLGAFLILLAAITAGMWLLWDTVLVRNTSAAAAWLAGFAPFITAGAAALLLVAGLKLFGKAQSE